MLSWCYLYLALGSAYVQANTLVNSSFEDPFFYNYPGLKYYSDSEVPGWSPLINNGRIYLRNKGQYAATQVNYEHDAYNGVNFIRLNDSNNSIDGIYQDVTTTQAGKQYTLSFYMRIGNWPGKLNADNVVVRWNGVETNVGGYGVSSTIWERIDIQVVGTGGTDRITLEESVAQPVDGVFDVDWVQLVENVAIGGGGGDPHFKTWTGIRYDYHGECDLVFLQNPLFNDGEGLHIHIRTVRKGYYSYIERAALQIGNNVLEFAGSNEWYKDGVVATKRPQQSLGKYKLRVHGKAVSVRIDEKRKLKIDFNHRHNGFLYLVVDGKDTDVFKGSLGMIGQWGSGQMVARDGVTILTDPEDMAHQWQVRDTDPILFQDQEGPQYPMACRPPKKFLGERLGSSTMRRRAEDACQSRSRDEVAECVFDVMATRDIGAAAF